MKTKTSYLSFYKDVLGKVSFDDYLFMKEYKKALKVLSNQEREELSRWIHEHYKRPKN